MRHSRGTVRRNRAAPLIHVDDLVTLLPYPLRMLTAFFNLHAETIHQDMEGETHADVASVVETAHRVVRELVSDLVRNGEEIDPSYSVRALDRAGALLATVSFGEVIRLRETPSSVLSVYARDGLKVA